MLPLAACHGYGFAMNFLWLKRLMPRSLYGRAALILIVPIVTIQLVVSIVFIQRHFEGVTEQMTRNIVPELNFLVAEVNDAPNLSAALERIGPMIGHLPVQVVFVPDLLISDNRLFYDLSARAVITTMYEEMSGIIGIDLLIDNRQVFLQLATDKGPMIVTFPRRSVSASNPHQLLVLMISTSLLMTVIAYLFLRNQLRPIKRLAVAASAFGRGQTVVYRPSGAAEVRVAGHAFLDMRNRIERQIEQRTLLLSGVSHDLRTPLTRLKLGLSMLEQDEDTKALVQDVNDMERLLGAFLDFARGDASEASVETDPVELVQRVVENARRGGRNVNLGPVQGVGLVNLRPMAVQRALENLIGNAVRYGKACQVSLSISPRAVRFSVEDDGPGIAADQREEALKPFTRLEPARNQNRGSGVGLGLSIAFDIARTHGGTLRLGTSESMGGLQVDLVLAR